MSKDKELANFVMDCYELVQEKNRSSDQSPLGPSTSFAPSSLLPAECAGSLDQPTSAAHGVISDHQDCSPAGPGGEGETNTTDTGGENYEITSGGAEPLNSVLLGDTVVEEYVAMENENAQGGHENYEEPGQQAEQEKQDFVLQMKNTKAENTEVVLIIKPAVISDHQYCSPVGPESEGKTNISDAGGENYEIVSGDADPLNTVPPGDTVVEEYEALENENAQGGHENYYGEPGQQAEQEKQGFVLHMTDTKAENTEVVLIIQPANNSDNSNPEENLFTLSLEPVERKAEDSQNQTGSFHVPAGVPVRPCDAGQAKSSSAGRDAATKSEEDKGCRCGSKITARGVHACGKRGDVQRSRCPCARRGRLCTEKCKCRRCCNVPDEKKEPNSRGCRCGEETYRRTKDLAFVSCADVKGKRQTKCPCFAGEVGCDEICRCFNCQNIYGASDRPFEPPKPIKRPRPAAVGCRCGEYQKLSDPSFVACVDLEGVRGRRKRTRCPCFKGGIACNEYCKCHNCNNNSNVSNAAEEVPEEIRERFSDEVNLGNDTEEFSIFGI